MNIAVNQQIRAIAPGVTTTNTVSTAIATTASDYQEGRMAAMSHDEVEDYIRDCPDISIPSLMREVVRRAVALRVFGSHRVMAEVVRLWADDQESKIEEIRKARRE